MDLALVIKRLFENGIQCFVSSGGNSIWEAKLGEETSGFVAEGHFKTIEECAAFLDAEARRLHPESAYAGGLW